VLRRRPLFLLSLKGHHSSPGQARAGALASPGSAVHPLFSSPPHRPPLGDAGEGWKGPIGCRFPSLAFR
jgi:hypothetical protein